MSADIVSQATRSRMMAGIGARDTKPELIVRRGLHALGYRFRLHDRRLPGRPDLVLPRWHAAIFVNGCFWHGHDCTLFKWPKSRRTFWREKIEGNRTRDRNALAALDDIGWRALTVWECALKGPERIGARATITAADRWVRSKTRAGEIRGDHGDSRAAGVA